MGRERRFWSIGVALATSDRGSGCGGDFALCGAVVILRTMNTKRFQRRRIALGISGTLVAIALAACRRDAGSRVPADDTTAAGATAAASAAEAAERASAARAASAANTRYVGLQYDSLPRDFHFLDGAVLPRGAGTGAAADYDFAHVRTPTGEMVWLDTIGAPVGKGLHARIVRAELPVPSLAADERLLMGSCDQGGRLDPRLVAIVVNDSGATRFTKIRQAWRVNIPAARFDLVPLAGITCEDPGT
jgi:hypothetical protein